MGNVLAKLPQQKIKAGPKHPTMIKLEKLFDYMDEIGIELEFDYDRIYVIDNDRPKDKYWEIQDLVNSAFLIALPCYPNEYKITQDVDISPRQAQSAPPEPKKTVIMVNGKNNKTKIKK